MLARMRGLLGRNELTEPNGILLNPAPSVHTFFMRFPIDVVFVDKSRTIVKVVHRLKPWRAAFARKAVAALELPEGTAARLDLSPGMSLVLGEPS